jgi:hypothetical protein
VSISLCALKASVRYVVNGSSMEQVEHIDNPKGYGEGKDPREVDPGLRPVRVVIALTIEAHLIFNRYYSLC